MPPGFHAPATFIEAGPEHDRVRRSSAEATATLPAKPVAQAGRVRDIDGKEVVHEVPLGLPKLIGTGDIVTTTRQDKRFGFGRAKETRFTVDIARQGKFAGRVPVEVKGLPHGVRVLDIGLNGILITERDTSREVTLYCEPWVKPTEHPIEVLARAARVPNAEFAAKPVVLKVEK